jgi:hypothetical protein
MSDQDIIKRFEELEAGRILGDLDAGEIMELEELSKDPRCKSDLSLDLAAAAIETEFLRNKGNALPAEMLRKLHDGKAGFILAAPVPDNIVRPAAWKRLLSAPQTAWAVAALFAMLFVAKSFFPNPGSGNGQTLTDITPFSTEATRNAFLGKAKDLTKSEFGGTEGYSQMTGNVVWSDELQEGYMTLTNLPANDPASKQYQLWIVDPDRDEKPVDGGVFDIPANATTAVIPIRNPLVVNDPKAFVITLEQPGGVVVSKQETVVALAKTS